MEYECGIFWPCLLLLETKNVSSPVDPVITMGILQVSRYTIPIYRTLSIMLLITHNHQDHILLERSFSCVIDRDGDHSGLRAGNLAGPEPEVLPSEIGVKNIVE